MKGYEAFTDGAAWLDVSIRGRVKVTGEDRARLLHAMTTNHIQQLTPGSGCYTFFLNAVGRILGDANILCFPDYLLLDTEAETRNKLQQHLDKFIIADDVTLEDITDGTAAIAVEGSRAAEILESFGVPVPIADYAHLDWGTRIVGRLNVTGSTGFFIIAPLAEKAALIAQLEAAGVVAGDAEAFRVVRIEHAKARYGEDITERYLVQETGQLQAVNFSKGCYLGQEIVERVRSRAQIHRMLKHLEIDTNDAPAPATKLSFDGKDAAEITSAAYSPRIGKTVALAYVKTDQAKPGDALQLGEAIAIVR